MLYPSISQLLTKEEEEGHKEINKYSLVMATSKCARLITNEYLRERSKAEKMIANKFTDRDLASLIKKEYRDERAVKNAVKALYEGDYEIVMPDEPDYKDSIVEVDEYNEEKEDAKFFEESGNKASGDMSEEDKKELMNSDDVYEETDGFGEEGPEE